MAKLPLAKRLTHFDLFVSPRIENDIVKRTAFGGALSLLAMVLCFTLAISELHDYLHVENHHAIMVDPQITGELPIFFNISFPHLSCDSLTLDVVDQAGNAQVNINHNVFKVPIRRDLHDHGTAFKTDVGHKHKDDHASPAETPADDEKQIEPGTKDCGSCYGAGEKDQCCNTCEEVKAAYKAKNWAIGTLRRFEQCHTISNDIGCRVQGLVRIARVRGNFHIAPGPSSQAQYAHIHALDAMSTSYNTSHIVHALAFGAQYPGQQNALDNHEYITDVSTMSQYFVSVVPTTYYGLNKHELDSNQYSCTASHHPVDGINRRIIPGFFILFDVSPTRLEVRQSRQSFGHFIVGLFAIIGGIMSLLSIVDNIFFASVRRMRRKAAVGKLG